MPDKVGQQLGNYRLIRLLGEGGFAKVYLGEHIFLSTQAAIKVLDTPLTSDKENILPLVVAQPYRYGLLLYILKATSSEA